MSIIARPTRLWRIALSVLKRKQTPGSTNSTAQCLHHERNILSTINHFSTTTKNAAVDKANTSQATRTKTLEIPDQGRAFSQKILITGGTSGIGFAIAQQAIAQGASHVRIVTRDTKRGEAAIEKLQKRRSSDIVLDYIQATTAEYGDSRLFQLPNGAHFTTVIHSAGISQTSVLTSTAHDAIRNIFDVNLVSAALLSKSFLKRYTQACRQASTTEPAATSSAPPAHPSPSWHMINISSLLAHKAGYGTSIYSASKAGLIALTRATALEGSEVTQRHSGYAPGFRANVVVPGYIETPMTNGISGKSREELIGKIPTARFGTSDEVADAVMFLMGNEYANNCALGLDGGLSAT